MRNHTIALVAFVRESWAPAWPEGAIFAYRAGCAQSPVKLLRIIELDAKSAIPNSGGTKSHPPEAERSVEDVDGASVGVVAD